MFYCQIRNCIKKIHYHFLMLNRKLFLWILFYEWIRSMIYNGYYAGFSLLIVRQHRRLLHKLQLSCFFWIESLDYVREIAMNVMLDNYRSAYKLLIFDYGHCHENFLRMRDAQFRYEYSRYFRRVHLWISSLGYLFN
jgi:hypothetical protein